MNAESWPATSARHVMVDWEPINAGIDQGRCEDLMISREPRGDGGRGRHSYARRN